MHGRTVQTSVRVQAVVEVLVIELRWLETSRIKDDCFSIEFKVLQFRTYTEIAEEVLENGVRGYKPKKLHTEWQDVPTVREE